MPTFRHNSYIAKELVSTAENDIAADFLRGICSGNLSIDNPDLNEETLQASIDQLSSSDESVKAKALKTLFFDDDSFLEFAHQYMHQGAIPWALESAIKSNINSFRSPNNKDPLFEIFGDDLKSQRNFKIDRVNGLLTVEENIQVYNISYSTGMGDEKVGEKVLKDKENLRLSAKASYAIKKDENGEWFIAKPHVIFQYRSNSLKKYLDTRSLAKKVKDFVRKSFGLRCHLSKGARFQTSTPWLKCSHGTSPAAEKNQQAVLVS